MWSSGIGASHTPTSPRTETFATPASRSARSELDWSTGKAAGTASAPRYVRHGARRLAVPPGRPRPGGEPRLRRQASGTALPRALDEPRPADGRLDNSRPERRHPHIRARPRSSPVRSPSSPRAPRISRLRSTDCRRQANAAQSDWNRARRRWRPCDSAWPPGPGAGHRRHEHEQRPDHRCAARPWNRGDASCRRRGRPDHDQVVRRVLAWPPWSAGTSPPSMSSGKREPRVLFSRPECRAVLLDLQEGEEMGDHRVHERAIVEVVSGKLEVSVDGESVECDSGTLLTFEPGALAAFGH